MKQACDILGLDRKYVDFTIVEGDIPVEYIVIPDKPLKYRRVIRGARQTTETFEYIDGTYELKFTVRTRYPREFAKIISVAGKIGLMSRTSKGYGKFRVTLRFKQ